MTTALWSGPIVDAHQHFWDPTANGHPWLRPDVVIAFRYGITARSSGAIFQRSILRTLSAIGLVPTTSPEKAWQTPAPCGRHCCSPREWAPDGRARKRTRPETPSRCESYLDL